MDNPLLDQLIAHTHDLNVQWANLAADRDGWKALAERYRRDIDEKNTVIGKLSDKLYEYQKDSEEARGKIHE